MSQTSQVLDQFVRRVIDTEQVYALETGSGLAWHPSEEYEDETVVLFWAESETATQVAANQFETAGLVCISLGAFLHHWLPTMNADEVRVGVSWDKDMNGPEFDAADLRSEIFDAMDQATAARYQELISDDDDLQQAA